MKAISLKLSFKKKKKKERTLIHLTSQGKYFEVTFDDEVVILIILKYEESQLYRRPCITSQSISNMTHFDVAFINEVVILIILKH